MCFGAICETAEAAGKKVAELGKPIEDIEDAMIEAAKAQEELEMGIPESLATLFKAHAEVLFKAATPHRAHLEALARRQRAMDYHAAVLNA